MAVLKWLRVLFPTLGKTLQLHLQACDVKGKEEKSGPENMLTESAATGDGIVTAVSLVSLSLSFTLSKYVHVWVCMLNQLL